MAYAPHAKFMHEPGAQVGLIDRLAIARFHGRQRYVANSVDVHARTVVLEETQIDDPAGPCNAHRTMFRLHASQRRVWRDTVPFDRGCPAGKCVRLAHGHCMFSCQNSTEATGTPVERNEATPLIFERSQPEAVSLRTYSRSFFVVSASDFWLYSTRATNGSK